MSEPVIEPWIAAWPESMPPALQERLVVWLLAWDAASLAQRIRIELSGRMVSSLGRAYLDRRIVRISAHLIEPGREALLEEVFCHEVAHLVVHERHGRGARPHGREWRALLRQVGSRVRVTVPREECAFLPAPPRRRRRRRVSRRARASHSWIADGLWSALRRLQGRLM